MPPSSSAFFQNAFSVPSLSSNVSTSAKIRTLAMTTSTSTPPPLPSTSNSDTTSLPASTSVSVSASAKQRRVSLALPSSDFRNLQAWSFRDDTRLDLLSTSNDNSKPLRLDGNAATAAPRNVTPHSEEGEKEPTQELIHLPEKRPRKKWSHEETQNLVRGCNKVRHFVIVRLCTLPLLEGSPFEDPNSCANGLLIQISTFFVYLCTRSRRVAI